MREILFRGQRVDTKEWVYGLLWKKKYNHNKIFISYFPDEDDHEDAVVVSSETVGQFTGLTDKNGKRIFEGDVVKGEFLWSDIVGQVVWGEYSHSKCDEYSCEHYGLYVKPIREVKNNRYENTGWDLYSMDMVEVIGNIHDNPELPEGDK